MKLEQMNKKKTIINILYILIIFAVALAIVFFIFYANNNRRNDNMNRFVVEDITPTEFTEVWPFSVTKGSDSLVFSCIAQSGEVVFYGRDEEGSLFNIFKDKEIEMQNAPTGFYETSDGNAAIYLSTHEGIIFESDYEAKGTVDYIELCEIKEELREMQVFAKSGRIYVTFPDDEYFMACILDESYRLLYKAEDVLRVIRFLDGVSFLTEEGLFEYDEASNGLKKVTKYSKKLTEMILESDLIEGDEEYDYYFLKPVMAGSGLNERLVDQVLCGVKGNKAYEILNLQAFDLKIDGCVFLSDNNGGFYVLESHFLNEGGKKLYHLTPTDESHVDERTRITFAGTGITPELTNAITDYNRQSKDYKVELVSYDSDNAKSGNVGDIQLDMVSGEQVDLIFLSFMQMNADTRDKVHLDLNEYFDKSSTVNKEALLKQTIKQSDDGRILSISPEFELRGFVSLDGKTVDDQKSYADFVSENTVIFNDSDPVFQVSSAMLYSGNRFVDVKNKETHFDDEFKQLIDNIKKQNQVSRISEEEYGDSLLADHMALLSYEHIAFPYTYLFYTVIAGDEPVVISNYGSKSAVLVPHNEIGVMKTSKNLDGVYDFLDYLFSKENYSKYFGKVYFPSLESEWQETLSYMKTRDTELKFGGDGIEVTMGAINENEEEWLNELVADSVFIYPMESKYLGIIEEETQTYIYGNVSYDEMVKNMENRIGIALNE